MGCLMASDRISIRIDPKLRRKLEEEAFANGQRESDVVREALKKYFSARGARETCYEVALRAGVIGAAKNAPRDLSTNRKYFRGFGRL